MIAPCGEPATAHRLAPWFVRHRHPNYVEVYDAATDTWTQAPTALALDLALRTWSLAPPDPPGYLSPEDALEEAWAFVAEIGRRVEDGDITGDLIRGAHEYVRRYEGDFPFLVSLKRWKRLTPGQARGVLNSMRFVAESMPDG